MSLSTNVGTSLFSSFPNASFPFSFDPQAYSFPVSSIAKLLSFPADISINFVPSIIFIGVLLLVVVPFPNSPLLLCPHAQSVPFSSMAKLCVRPADILVNFVLSLFVICTNELLFILVPSPN